MADANLRTDTAGSYVEWAPVIAGGLIAAAMSFVFLTFGSAVGLSMTSPWATSGTSAKTAASIAAFWTIAQHIAAFMIGGYVAGRMRMRWADTKAEEVEFRDGLHGGLVWAIGVVIGAVLVLSAAGSIAKTSADALSKVAGAAAANADPLSYQIDALLRPATAAPAGPVAPGATPTAAANPAPAAPNSGQAQGPSTELRSELGRIVAKSMVAGSLADADRTYLAGVVAQRTGLSQADAERRITESYAEATRVAKETADKARRTAVAAGLVAAIALLFSFAAACCAGIQGGHHRDNAVSPISFLPRALIRQ